MAKKTVVVGISGGVDSSVAAYLLKEKYNVIGLFMRNWDSSVNGEFNYNETGNICPQEVDYHDALSVCKKLNIPLHRVDFIKEYCDDVFTYLLDELKNGRTPNPDLFCNRYIKFDLFIEEAKKLGADYIATGHYAKLDKAQQNLIEQIKIDIENKSISDLTIKYIEQISISISILNDDNN